PTGGTPGKINSVNSTSGFTEKLSVTNLSLPNDSTLVINFSQNIDLPLAGNSESYTLSGLRLNSITSNNQSVSISISKVETGKIYSFEIKGLKDCVGNPMDEFTGTFGRGRTPEKFEILITEIMADETPVVGLPEAEFVEIWNRTNQVLSLDGVFLNDGGTSRANFPAGSVLLPNEYAIVCGSTRGNLFTSFGKVFALSSFPSLTNSGKSLFLRRADLELIDQVTYSDTWYRDNVKRDGGWTLEMINPDQNCLGGVNWMASIDPTGGTPGKINSVNSTSGFTEKLSVTSLSLPNDSTLVINFSQNIDLPLAGNSESYTLSGLSLNSISTLNQSVSISISKVETGKIYSLEIKGLKDCVGNPMDDFTGTFGRGRTPEKFEILITEIMADESPVVSLPEAEFVEIWNRTKDVLSLEGLSFTDGRSFARFPNTAVIMPDEYVLITSTSRATLFEKYGRVFGLSSVPTLTNSGKLVYLHSSQKGVIHAVEYSDTWHESNLKNEGGWTLEMVDTQNPCKGEGNWASSNHPDGGTPCRKNSIATSNPDLTAPNISLAFASNPNTVILKAHEPLDSLSIVSATFTWPENNSFATTGIRTSGIFNQEISLSTNFDFQPKTIYQLKINGIRDCVGNLMAETIIPINLSEPDEKGDVLLSEVLFDPRTGGNDFVEIYNASNKFINLNGWSLARLRDGLVDSKHPISTENLILKPGNYLAITDNAQNIKDNYPRTPDSSLHQANRIPAYLADSSTVLLFNDRDSLVQKFFYNRRFHHAMVDNRKGVSLERVSFSLPENLRENWHSAAASVGYATPGLPNSQQRNYALDFENSFEVSPRVISPDNDGWDDFAYLNYKFDETGFMGSIQVIDSRGRIVKHIVRNELMGTEGVYKWDGSDDMGNKAPVGYYVFHIEVFNMNGTTQTLRKPVAVYFGRN
ncbi:MAG: lamin tail domain-containing protein, partial [Cytophagales bacterium]